MPRWFPVAPGITTLPAAPAIIDTAPTTIIGTIATVGATPQTALNAAFPAAVSGNGVQDLTDDHFWKYNGTTWADVGPNPGPTMTVPVVLPVWQETVLLDARVRVGLEAQSFGYALQSLTTVPALGIKVLLQGAKIRKVESPAATLTVAGLAPAVVSGGAALAPAATMAIGKLAPEVLTGAGVQVPAADTTIAGMDPQQAGKPRTQVNIPFATVAIAAPVPAVASGASIAAPAPDTAIAAAVPVAGGYDPSFSSVALLLHMDGSNNSTTFTDSSSNALTVTASGNAKVSTAQNKYGGASALFDGTDDYLSLGSSLPTALQIGGGDFTVEAWVYLSATTTQSLIGNLNDNDGTGSWWVILNSTFGGLHTVQFGAASSGTFKFGTSTLATSQWVHVAVSRSGSSIRCFVDGTQLGSTQTCNNFTGSYSVPALIGISYHTTLGYTRYPFNGYIDELRVKKTARYTANFTPPTVAFPDR